MDKKTIILVALAIIAIMNIAAFVLMGHDKKRARQGKWRVPEKALFLVTACFGGLGGVLGMKVFHHKTQHWYAWLNRTDKEEEPLLVARALLPEEIDEGTKLKYEFLQYEII